MGLVAGRGDQGAALDLGEALALETGPQGGLDPPPLQQQGAAVGMVLGVPPGHLRYLHGLPAIAPAKFP